MHTVRYKHIHTQDTHTYTQRHMHIDTHTHSYRLTHTEIYTHMKTQRYKYTNTTRRHIHTVIQTHTHRDTYTQIQNRHRHMDACLWTAQQKVFSAHGDETGKYIWENTSALVYNIPEVQFEN